MSTATLTVAAMAVAVLGLTGLALIIDWHDDREQALLTAIEAIKRAEQEQQHRAALAARIETRVTRGHDRVPLTLAEEQLFAEITDHLGPVMRRVSTAVCECSHSREAHEHYRGGIDCPQCGCERYRKRGRMSAREVIRVTKAEAAGQHAREPEES